jgi:hypothetical protein
LGTRVRSLRSNTAGQSRHGLRGALRYVGSRGDNFTTGLNCPGRNFAAHSHSSGYRLDDGATEIHVLGALAPLCTPAFRGALRRARFAR